jgi:hypothetical protein
MKTPFITLFVTCFIASSTMATEKDNSSKGHIHSFDVYSAKQDKVEVKKRNIHTYHTFPIHQEKSDNKETALTTILKENTMKLMQLPMETWLNKGIADGKISDTEMKTKTREWINKKGEKGFLENAGQMMDMNGKPVPFVLFKVEVNGMNMYIT